MITSIEKGNEEDLYQKKINSIYSAKYLPFSFNLSESIKRKKGDHWGNHKQS